MGWGYRGGRGRRYDPRAEERRAYEAKMQASVERGRAALRRLLKRYEKYPLAGGSADHAWKQPTVRTYAVGRTANAGTVDAIVRKDAKTGMLYLQEAGNIGWHFYALVPRRGYARDDVESIGHHGYAPPRQETEAQRLRRLAERRRRYHRTTQSQGEQGPGYDQRRPRHRRSRRSSR